MKRLIQLIAILLLTSLLLTSCGTYTPAVDGPSTPSEPTNPDNPVTPDEPKDAPYTVTLNVNGKAYTPNEANGPYFVQWSNGFSVHVAELIDGKAEIYGLDDDYTVTLLNVPSSYTYNANAYVATADNRDISIELIKPIRTSGDGSGEYNRISLTKTGVYQVKLLGANHMVYFDFQPQAYGNYIIESWVDVTENNVNPGFKLYSGTVGAIYYSKYIDDGGAASTYTKNFRYERTVYVDEVGTTGGSMIIPFGICATAKSEEYPVTVTFAITKDGEMDRENTDVELMIPEETLIRTPNYSSTLYTLTGTEINEGGNNVFKGEMFKLWAKGTGMPMSSLSGERDGSLSSALSGEYQTTFINPRSDRKIVRTISFNPTSELAGWVEITEQDFKAGTSITGVYSYTVCRDHVFDNLNDNKCNTCGCGRIDDKKTPPPSISVKHQSGSKVDYAGFTLDYNGVLYYGTGDNFYHFYDEENGTWGEILYAYVSAPGRFIDKSFDAIEYEGNKFLTVNNGTQNYKFFIEGFKSLGNGGFCVNFPDNDAICPCLESGKCHGACAFGCKDCHPQCTQVPQEVLDSQGGYSDYTNQDGVYAVTEELRIFLQSYSTSQLLFCDGNGWVESNPNIKIYSNEDDQWLFACAYYEKK